MAVTYCWNAFFEDRLYSRVSVRDMDRGKTNLAFRHNVQRQSIAYILADTQP